MKPIQIHEFITRTMQQLTCLSDLTNFWTQLWYLHIMSPVEVESSFFARVRIRKFSSASLRYKVFGDYKKTSGWTFPSVPIGGSGIPDSSIARASDVHESVMQKECESFSYYHPCPQNSFLLTYISVSSVGTHPASYTSKCCAIQWLACAEAGRGCVS